MKCSAILEISFTIILSLKCINSMELCECQRNQVIKKINFQIDRFKTKTIRYFLLLSFMDGLLFVIVVISANFSIRVIYENLPTGAIAWPSSR